MLSAKQCILQFCKRSSKYTPDNINSNKQKYLSYLETEAGMNARQHLSRQTEGTGLSASCKQECVYAEWGRWVQTSSGGAANTSVFRRHDAQGYNTGTDTSSQTLREMQQHLATQQHLLTQSSTFFKMQCLSLAGLSIRQFIDKCAQYSS